MKRKNGVPHGYCLITGASTGIGLEFAKVFAEKGHDLILVARTQKKLEDLAMELQKSSPINVRIYCHDLTKSQEREDLYKKLSEEKLFVETLVNNAGFGLGGEFGSQPAARQLEMIDLNVTALTHLTRLFLPNMIEKGSGYVLNVASTAAFVPGPLMAVYYATKAFVVSLTEALATELEDKNIVVSALCPGPTRTEFQKVAKIESSKLFEASVMEARPVAEFGYENLMKGNRIAVPGFKNRFLAFSSRFAPRRVLAKTVKKLNTTRIN